MNDSLSNDLQALRLSKEDRKRKAGPAVRIVLIVGAVFLVLGLGITLVYPKLEAKFFKAKVEVTEIASISPAQASIELTSTGYVVPQTTSKVGARTQGRIARVFIKEGDVVKAGDLLVELDSAQQKSSIATARARVATAQARAQNARANLAEITIQLERQRTLAEGGAVSASVVSDLEARVDTLKQAVEVAQAEAKAAAMEVSALSVSLEFTTIVAPIAGTVIGKPQEIGEMVGLGLERDALVEIADMGSLMVETDVPENRLGRIKIGGPAEITLDAYAGKRFRGEVKEIRPKINRAKATGVVKVRFLDSTEGVLPEMSARVSFLSRALDENSLSQVAKTVVPKAAVLNRNGKNVVFVVQNGKVAEVPVELGPELGNAYELKKGPSPGTRVVSQPNQELTDGQRIEEDNAS